MAYLITAGVKVTLLYGDRDWACNWKGGEAASLAIPHPLVPVFAGAGYAPLALSPFRSAGLTRQVGPLLSFSRIYQAGHMVPAYQPEAAYEVFMRALTNRDIATGKVRVNQDEGMWYRTEGGGSWRGVDSDVIERGGEEECYVLMPGGTCRAETWEGVREGRKKVRDWIVVGDVDDEEDVGQKEKEGRDGVVVGEANGGIGNANKQAVLGPNPA